MLVHALFASEVRPIKRNQLRERRGCRSGFVVEIIMACPLHNLQGLALRKSAAIKLMPIAIASAQPGGTHPSRRPGRCWRGAASWENLAAGCWLLAAGRVASWLRVILDCFDKAGAAGRPARPDGAALREPAPAPTHDELFAWLLTKEKGSSRQGGEPDRGQQPVDLARTGTGLPSEQCIRAQLAADEFIEVLTDWRKTFDQYYLYYPNHRLASSVFSLLLDEPGFNA